MGAYDSHPPLRDRIEAANRLQLSQTPAPDVPAFTLFGDLMAEEARLFAMSNSAENVAKLKTFDWRDAAAILPEKWRDIVRKNAQFLGDATAENLPDIWPRLAEIGARIPDPKGMLLKPEQRTARAAELFGVAIALAIADAGWPLHITPGERYYLVGEERLSVRELLNQLATGKLSRQQWSERCQTLRIHHVRLASLGDRPNAASTGSA